MIPVRLVPSHVNTVVSGYWTASNGMFAGGRANMFTHLLARSGYWHCSHSLPRFTTQSRDAFFAPYVDGRHVPARAYASVHSTRPSCVSTMSQAPAKHEAVAKHGFVLRIGPVAGIGGVSTDLPAAVVF